jgi:hypothetical protein
MESKAGKDPIYELVDEPDSVLCVNYGQKLFTKSAPAGLLNARQCPQRSAGLLRRQRDDPEAGIDFTNLINWPKTFRTNFNSQVWDKLPPKDIKYEFL